MLPPNWRGAKLSFAIALLAPLFNLLEDFQQFRTSAELRVNLSAQTIVIEHHIRAITGLNYGVYITQTSIVNQFKVNVPIGSINYRHEIALFLNKIIPAGKDYEILFY